MLSMGPSGWDDRCVAAECTWSVDGMSRLTLAASDADCVPVDCTADGGVTVSADGEGSLSVSTLAEDCPEFDSVTEVVVAPGIFDFVYFGAVDMSGWCLARSVGLAIVSWYLVYSDPLYSWYMLVESCV